MAETYDPQRHQALAIEAQVEVLGEIVEQLKRIAAALEVARAEPHPLTAYMDFIQQVHDEGHEAVTDP